MHLVSAVRLAAVNQLALVATFCDIVALLRTRVHRSLLYRDSYLILSCNKHH